MSRRFLALALASTLVPGIAGARKKDKDDDKEEKDAKKDSKKDKDADSKDDTSDEEPASDEEPDPPDEDDTPKKDKKGKKDEFVKQDLTGHDLAGSQKSNLFEKDRFFVDKVDSTKTEKGTLVQGSLTATTFAYKETGGNLTGNGVGTTANVPSGSEFSRIFTDLRLQTDFRHIGGGKFDARVDVRGRVTTDPGSNTQGYTPATNSSSQSGFLGQNELEIRELWIIHSGKRSDVTVGRQFVADLAGVKLDGLRIDYAQSEKFTLLGFGGLYPIRGSRSITTDYTPLKGEPDPTTGVRPDAGKFTGTGGFGAAYRTQNAYGAFGGVAIAPLSSESPRFFGTSTGYWRAGPKLDFYHFAVLDVLGSNAVNAGLTNLSLGLNLKPDQRIRATLSFNRVDTETLNTQAQAFLQDPDKNVNIIQNEAFLIRVAQNAARGSVSVGLGPLQRFEVSVATALRFRGEIDLAPGGMAMGVTLPAGKSVEVYGAITDRHSFKKLRLGLDASRIFKQGGDAYQRTTSNQFRVFAGRELENGHGEWEGELAYSKAQDDNAGTGCDLTNVLSCYGSATSSALSLGGNYFYRFNRDWLGMASLFINRQSITSNNGAVGTADPPVLGLSGFVRAAYRF